ncbi:MAG: cytidine deaminase [Jiangellales bacterium]
MSDLHPEDAKIVTLARAARARTGAPSGAAVRDTDGRTYAAAAVTLSSLPLSSMQAAVAMAASAGAQGLEAAVTDAGVVHEADMAALRELGGVGVPVLLVDARGTLVDHLLT